MPQILSPSLRLAAATTLALLAPAAASAESFSVTFTDVGSDGGFGNPGNDTGFFTYSGPDFLIGEIDVVGTVVNQGDALASPAYNNNFLSDAVIAITRPDLDPDPVSAVVDGSTQTNVASDSFANLGQDSADLEGESAIGSYTFEFFEAFDFDEVDGFDNVFETLTITFNELLPPDPPESIRTVVDPDGSVSVEFTEDDQVAFFEFYYDGVGDLFFTTVPSDLEGDPADDNYFGDNDTELGLYDSLGNLLVVNDDAPGGTGRSVILIDGGLLDAGTYYLAAGGYNTTFGDEFDVTADSTQQGTLVVTGLSAVAVPEPSVALAGLVGAGLLLMRRRR